MELTVSVRLIEKGVMRNLKSQEWADLGAGKGVFTKALATLLSKDSTIHAVDTNAASLNSIEISTNGVTIRKIQKNFITEDLGPIQFDGVMMGNSLHFVSEKFSFIKKLKKSLKKSGHLIIVEYDIDRSNTWVPFPLTFARLQKLARDTGFTSVSKIGEAPSVFNRANMYSAVLTL